MEEPTTCCDCSELVELQFMTACYVCRLLICPSCLNEDDRCFRCAADARTKADRLTMSDRPIDHVLRPHLPWREAPGLTECGLEVTGSLSVISRDEFVRRMKEMGERRTQIATCMTCLDTSRRWGTWDDDPRQQLGRELAWETRWATNRGRRLRDELEAIAALIAAHPDEFAELVRVAVRRQEWANLKEAKTSAGRPS